MDIADVGGIENPAAVNGIEGKAMSIELDIDREERIKELVDKYDNGTHQQRQEMIIREAVALGESFKIEEIICSGCHRKLDLPWYCKDCENKENKVGGGGGSILPLDRIGNEKITVVGSFDSPPQNGSESK